LCVAVCCAVCIVVCCNTSGVHRKNLHQARALGFEHLVFHLQKNVCMRADPHYLQLVSWCTPEVLQYTATHCNMCACVFMCLYVCVYMYSYVTMHESWHLESDCNTLQHTATHCNTLQHCMYVCICMSHGSLARADATE